MSTVFGIQMSAIGERLREERNRLGLSQSDFGSRCGVQKNTQIHYESGERDPKSDYLVAAAGLGVDVLYVITGARSAPAGGAVISSGEFSTALTAEEVALLDNYRHSDDAGKRAVEAAAAALARPTREGDEKAA